MATVKGRTLKKAFELMEKIAARKGYFDKNPGGGKDARKFNIGGRANLLEEMGRIDARRHPDAADRAEKRRVIGELNKGYKSGGAIKVRDINKDGKKEGWEVARAKGMAKGMGKRLKMNSGGAVLKGKKVGCQIK